MARVPRTSGRISDEALADAAGPFSGVNLLASSRSARLNRLRSYFRCGQHDGKKFDFSGAYLPEDGGMYGTQPLLPERPPDYVPLSMRRPSSPMRLAKSMVRRLSNFTLGSRFPELVSQDDKTKQFLLALKEAGSMVKAIRESRDMGGSTGTGPVSWAYVDGKPRYRIHHPASMFVHKWDDFDAKIPRKVTECYLYAEDRFDSQKRRWQTVTFWHRTDFTPDAEVAYVEQEYEPGKDPEWVPDVEKSIQHDDGRCHVVWIQNQPMAESIDGLPDYEGEEENLDDLDVMCSVVARGGVLNLDPTLVIKEDRQMLAATGQGIKKGSDNAIVISKDGGDAKYLELSGMSIEKGILLCNQKVRWICDSCGVVQVDPDKVAASAVSRVALELVHEPQIGVANFLTDQYGEGMRQLLDGQLEVARAKMGATAFFLDDEGNEQEGEAGLDLPPHVEKVPEEEGGDGTETREVEQHPGEGEDVQLKWGPYFKPTPAEIQSGLTALSTAAGGVAIISAKMANQEAMGVLGRDPDADEENMAADKEEAEQKQADMLEASADAMGGAVPGKGAMPPGATPKGGPPGAGPPKPPPGQDDEGDE